MTNEEAIKWLDAEIHRAEYINAMWLDCVQVEPLMQIRELLTAQQPRVLTLEEVLGGDECWVEYINGGCGYCDCYLDDDAKSIVINRTLRKDFNVSPNEYGTVWRCWTAKPTDEQREATPWGEPPKEGDGE